MAIKVGFSSLACPDWDFKTMVEQAAAMGYDGIELRGLVGKFHLPNVPELAADPGSTKRLLADAGVELVCLGSLASFESPSLRECERNRQELTETIELAGKLGCPYVRIVLGDVAGSEHRRTLSWVAEELQHLTDTASRYGTTILVENGGDFVRSEDLWFVLDVVSHPAVRGCWNPVQALARGERPTISVPRLGPRLAMFHVCDARFDAQGRFSGHRIPGEGNVELARAIDLLKGVCYQGWLVFEWPKTNASLPEPEEVLPKAVAFMRERLRAKQEVLSAYKGDKRPPNFKASLAVDATPDK